MDIDGHRKKIDTPVSFFDFSAHAGMADLHSYIKQSAPNTVVCVHGDRQNAISAFQSLRGVCKLTPTPRDSEKL